MKYLGIDYGSKRVGIALSDDGGTIAFPKEILANDRNLIENVVRICRDEGVRAVVLGESRDFSGAENPIMKKVILFSEKLKKEMGLTVFFETEFLTSHEASKRMNEAHATLTEREDGRAGRSPEKKESVDASAAAIILQSFLEKNKNK